MPAMVGSGGAYTGSLFAGRWWCRGALTGGGQDAAGQTLGSQVCARPCHRAPLGAFLLHPAAINSRSSHATSCSHKRSKRSVEVPGSFVGTTRRGTLVPDATFRWTVGLERDQLQGQPLTRCGALGLPGIPHGAFHMTSPCWSTRARPGAPSENTTRLAWTFPSSS